MHSLNVQVLLEADCALFTCSGSAGGRLCIIYVQVLLDAGCVVYMFRFCWRLVVYSLYV